MPLLSEQLVPTAGLLPSFHERRYLAEGVKGTEQTISIMQKLAADGKRDIQIRELVGKIINGEIEGMAGCQSKDYACYAKSIYEFCRDKIKYLYDPHLVEYVENPRRILQTKVADCDSNCVLLAAMFECAGFECQFVTIKADPQRRDDFSHVYTRVKVPHLGWVVADPTMPKKWFGWEPPGDWEKRYWAGSTDELEYSLDTQPSVPVPADSPLSGFKRRLNMYGLGNMGATYNTNAELNAAYGRIDWDFRTGVGTMPVVATAPFAADYNAIIKSLQNFSKMYLVSARGNPNGAASPSASGALDQITAAINAFKTSIQRTTGQATREAPPQPDGSSPLSSPALEQGFVSQYKWYILAGASVAALLIWKPWKRGQR